MVEYLEELEDSHTTNPDLGFEVEGKRTLVQFGQGFASMSAPTKEVEKMVLSKEIAHGGNPVLSWMVSLEQ